MESVPLNAVSLVRALQGVSAADLPVKEGALLAALMGQDVLALLEAQTPEGVRLRLPQGALVTAQGELPYPVGTSLKLRVQASDQPGGVRLQTLEAHPPKAASLLDPLVFGEALNLLSRLAQADVEPGLVPLRDLALPWMPSGNPAAPEAAVPVPNGLPGTSPASEENPLGLPARLVRLLEEGLPTLPAPTLERLTNLLQLPKAATPKALAEALQAFLQRREAAPESDPLPTAASLRPEAKALMARFETLLASLPDLPPSARQGLLSGLRALLTRLEEPTPEKAPKVAASRLESRPTAQASAPALMPAGVEDRAGMPLRGLPQASGLAQLPERMETWEGWLKESMRVLSDPAVSPRQAPFHMAQALDRTAFYELPLPWMPAGQGLQLWVEWGEEGPDAPAEAAGTARVLLAVRFSALGETRVGLEQTPQTLTVRIWTEHPEAVESQRSMLEGDLGTLKRRLDLRVMPLGEAAPDLRQVVQGRSWSGLA